MDAFIFQKINDLALKNYWLDTLGIFFADYLAYILAVALFLFLAWNFRKYQKMVVLALGAGVLSRGITEAIRFLWDRPRPYIENHVHLLINKVNAASFPSAHAAFFFGISLILYLYNKKAGLVFFGASILIAIARVFVAVHYPSDILAGISVGIISAIVIIKIFKG